MGGVHLMIGKIRLVYTEKHKLHKDPGERHVENPWRVEELLSALKSGELWSYVELVEPPVPGYNTVLLAHSSGYVEWLKRECAKGFHYIDPDTYVTEHSCDLAASFASASSNATLKVLNEGGVWVILARPGGHHAGRDGVAMGAPTLGFCLVDYTSIAVLTALSHGAMPLAIDFDAHHGNGSQEILWNNPCAVHVDIHEWGIYPGTGWVTDIGGPGAEGTKINIPLYSNASGDSEYIWILENVIKRVVNIVKPSVVIVFAGFDAHALDPITGLNATETTFTLYGSYIRELIASGFVRGAVIILGGGYGRGLVSGFTSFLEGLLGLKKTLAVVPKSPGAYIEEAIPSILHKLEKTLESKCYTFARAL